MEKPTVEDEEVLVKVHSAAANPYDWHLMRATPFIARLMGGLRRPKDTRVGVDVAGRVEAIGRRVTRFKPGDDVFGFAHGSFAEYAVAREDGLARKPGNLSFEFAAAVPMAALTALQALRDGGHLQAGQHVLINGASGGVGTFAVQIAKSFGAEVTGVCSTGNLEMVRAIGADHVIDYTREDLSRNGHRYDVILDAVGNLSASSCKRALNPQGVGVIVGFPGMLRLIGLVVRGKLASKTPRQRVGFFGAHRNDADLRYLKELSEAGKIVPVIDRRYPLGEAREAIRYLETGHARGKVVIAIVPNS